MSADREDLILLDEEGEVRYITEDDLSAIQTVTESVAEVIAGSPWPNLDPEAYFIWMYSVEPFAES